eukprot:TRINITY_DN18121_c0_g1_i1.p1 TRINITY_DN18121_c0_g1~~TRINITY_DN18121_c0_g1_i1.p1  ORF type:complete len:1038 (+),score=221.48 TRINITY_DN18121_c0_g1_i1:141-3254(+)
MEEAETARRRFSAASSASSSAASRAAKRRSTLLRENAAGNAIQVAVRIRPLNSAEQKLGKAVWNCQERTVEELDDDSRSCRGKTYTYDRVFGPEASTIDVYNAQVKQIVQKALIGFNGTIFAYGQTASGKTHTIVGDPDTNPGIIPLSVSDIFEAIAQRQRSSEWNVFASYLEVYNESLTDLLQKDVQKGVNMRIAEDKMFGPVVRDLCEVPVSSAQDCLDCLADGEQRRAYAATGMNATSSRSHVLFRLRIESKSGPEGYSAAETAGNMSAVARDFLETQRLCAADRASLYLIDRDSNELYIQAGDITLRLPMSQGIAGSVATTRQTVNIADAYQDPRFDSSVDKKTGYVTRHILCMPILASVGGKEAVVGVVQFINKIADDSSSFDTEDEKNMKELTTRIGPMIAATQSKAPASTMSLLNMVDLAGSERVKKTGATGALLKEGSHINTSLMMLGTCISILSEGKEKHVPFRNSKLTYLLSSSLGGNANTSVIIAVSAALKNRSETQSSLQFGSRAKKIVNQVAQNIRRDQTELVQAYEQEIAKLKAQLLSAAARRGSSLTDDGGNGDSSPGSPCMRVSMGTRNGGVDAVNVDVSCSDSFTTKLRLLESEASEAEAISGALTAPTAPQVKLRVLVGVSPDGVGEPELIVASSRYPDPIEGLDDPDAKEYLTEKEFRRRLEHLRARQSEASGSHSTGPKGLGVMDSNEDVWAAAAASTGTPDGLAPYAFKADGFTAAAVGKWQQELSPSTHDCASATDAGGGTVLEPDAEPNSAEIRSLATRVLQVVLAQPELLGHTGEMQQRNLEVQDQLNCLRRELERLRAEKRSAVVSAATSPQSRSRAYTTAATILPFGSVSVPVAIRSPPRSLSPRKYIYPSVTAPAGGTVVRVTTPGPAFRSTTPTAAAPPTLRSCTPPVRDRTFSMRPVSPQLPSRSIELAAGGGSNVTVSTAPPPATTTGYSTPRSVAAPGPVRRTIHPPVPLRSFVSQTAHSGDPTPQAARERAMSPRRMPVDSQRLQQGYVISPAPALSPRPPALQI